MPLSKSVCLWFTVEEDGPRPGSVHQASIELLSVSTLRMYREGQRGPSGWQRERERWDMLSEL